MDDEKQKRWAAITLICAVGVLAIIGTGIVLNMRCDSKCHPRRGNSIEGACHCATDTGWDRLEGD